MRVACYVRMCVDCVGCIRAFCVYVWCCVLYCLLVGVCACGVYVYIACSLCVVVG